MSRGRPKRPPSPSKPAPEPSREPPAERPKRRAEPAPAPAPALDLDQPLLGRRLPLPRWLAPPTDALRLRWFVLAVGLIWVLGVVLRTKWLFDFGYDAAPTLWKGTPLLTSSDGYYFAAGVQAAVAGDTHGRTRLPDPTENAMVAIGWLVVKLFGTSVDSFALYFPAFAGPLIAVPLAAMGRSLRRSALGLVAALAAVVAPGYFTRTAAGYFDSDPFAIVAPLAAVAFLVAQLAAAERDARRPRALGITGAALLAATPFFYDQGGPVSMAIAVVAVLVLLLFHRDDAFAFPLIAGLGLGQLTLPWPICVALAIVAPLALARLPLPRLFARGVPLALCGVGFFLSPTWHAMLVKLHVFTGDASYIIGNDAGGDGPPEPIFADTTRFVAEAQRIALVDIGARVLGWLPLAVVAGLGALLAVLRARALLLLGPFAAVGLFSIIGGLRFTIYLSPVAALGAAWLAVAVVSALVDLVTGPPQRHPTLPRRLARPLAVAVVGALVSTPGLANVWVAHPRPTVVAPEVAAMDELRQRMKVGDVVVGWWDYGYSLGYWTQGRTIVDGGRRYQDANVVAEMLAGSSQRAAANLARLITARLDKHPDLGVAPFIFREAKQRGLGPATYLATLAKEDATVPPVEADIYFYLPARMLSILPALDQLRPKEKGQKRPPPRGAPPVVAKADGERLMLPGGVVVDGKAMTVESARGRRGLRRIYSVSGGAGRPAEVKQRDGDPTAATSGVFLRAISTFAELDERLIESVYVQLFAFERADPRLFELVYSNEAAKIYRLRR